MKFSVSVSCNGVNCYYYFLFYVQVSTGNTIQTTTDSSSSENEMSECQQKRSSLKVTFNCYRRKWINNKPVTFFAAENYYYSCSVACLTLSVNILRVVDELIPQLYFMSGYIIINLVLVVPDGN